MFLQPPLFGWKPPKLRYVGGGVWGPTCLLLKRRKIFLCPWLYESKFKKKILSDDLWIISLPVPVPVKKALKSPFFRSRRVHPNIPSHTAVTKGSFTPYRGGCRKTLLMQFMLFLPTRTTTAGENHCLTRGRGEIWGDHTLCRQEWNLSVWICRFALLRFTISNIESAVIQHWSSSKMSRSN